MLGPPSRTLFPTLFFYSLKLFLSLCLYSDSSLSHTVCLSVCLVVCVGYSLLVNSFSSFLHCGANCRLAGQKYRPVKYDPFCHIPSHFGLNARTTLDARRQAGSVEGGCGLNWFGLDVSGLDWMYRALIGSVWFGQDLSGLD